MIRVTWNAKYRHLGRPVGDMEILFNVIPIWSLLSAPVPTAQMHYRDHALSVVRPSSLTYQIFVFFSDITERYSTKFDRKQDLNVLYQVCVFRADQKSKMATRLWLAEKFSNCFLHLLNGIQRNLTGNKISTFSTNFVFFEPIGKPRCHLIGWDIFRIFLYNRIQRKQDVNVFYQVCVFWAYQEIYQDRRPGL